jgi:predicted lipid carrier protein YhbT
MHALLTPFLILALRLLSLGRDARRHLPDFEGQAIGLRLRGHAKPYMVAVRDGRLVLAPDARPEAEIEGDLRTFLEMLLGKLDYDAAFFRKRISFRGSLPAAMRFKALFDHLTP